MRKVDDVNRYIVPAKALSKILTLLLAFSHRVAYEGNDALSL